ncbi:unnamed protein product [Arctia plantaginis]|uniref:Uncharacterized protein n=1 Tax=Arctia plantaginis TaxID=874455 RepID=A0A8S1BGX0_ARCPL|nr:unnamed protein product [Arctia plantaginis]
MRTGSGADEVYTPKLWYYTELEFLNDQIGTPSSVSSSESSLRSVSQRKNKKQTEQENRDQVLAKILKKLDNIEDEFDVVGKNIANKLRSMDADQKIHAEKIINDALYFGTLKHLTLDSCITGTLGRMSNVVEKLNFCSTSFASEATYSQSVAGPANYTINNNKIVRSNQNVS